MYNEYIQKFTGEKKEDIKILLKSETGLQFNIQDTILEALSWNDLIPEDVEELTDDLIDLYLKEIDERIVDKHIDRWKDRDYQEYLDDLHDDGYIDETYSSEEE